MGCPNCGQPMTVFWARRWFKLFFILPLFPTAAGSYVQGCQAATCPADQYYSINQQEAAQIVSGQKIAA